MCRVSSEQLTSKCYLHNNKIIFMDGLTFACNAENPVLRSKEKENFTKYQQKKSENQQKKYSAENLGANTNMIYFIHLIFGINF